MPTFSFCYLRAIGFLVAPFTHPRSCFRCWTILCLWLWTTSLAWSQPQPQLVKDINTYPSPTEPPSLIDVNGTVFFVASDEEHGPGLWKSDGTAAGTLMIKDINSETDHHSIWTSDGSPLTSLTVVNGTLFFYGDDGVHGWELWKSDGTPAGTVMVRDIQPGGSGSDIGYFYQELNQVNGVLYFYADDGQHGPELWRSDGTEVGTLMVKDINPGAGGSDPSWEDNAGIQYLVNANGLLLFFAQAGGLGPELWKSDGTAAGTVLVREINPGWGAAISQYGSQNFAYLNGSIYFAGEDGVHGYELWKSDGTEIGTVMVKDITMETDDWYTFASYGERYLTTAGSAIYFVVGNERFGAELWKSDGTEAGTLMVKDINPGAGGSNPSFFTVVNGTLYFQAYDDVHGNGLWKSDGTEAGTVMVKNSAAYSLTSFKDQLFFTAQDGQQSGLWRTDGTEAGTILVKSDTPGEDTTTPRKLTATQNALFFFTLDATKGHLLWTSDGTAGGTQLVKDIHPGTGSALVGNVSLVNVNGTLFFTADDGLHGSELWKSDGTAEGTALVKDISPGKEGTPVSSLTSVGSTLFFLSNGQLWQSDGTETVLVKENLRNPRALVDIRGRLFFLVDNESGDGQQLWQSDGTLPGTHQFIDSNPFHRSDLQIWGLTNVNGTLYFTSHDTSAGDQLWRSDGTLAGTRLLAPIKGEDFFSLHGYIYFRGTPNDRRYGTYDPSTHAGAELWRTDTATNATSLVKDIYPGQFQDEDAGIIGNSSAPAGFTNLNGTLYFTANDGEHGEELWKSDGTATGTVLFKDINPGENASYPGYITVANGTLYFQAYDGEHGYAFWKSDGTPAGTVLAKDFNPAANNSQITEMINVNDILYLIATDGTLGWELWKNDGTEAGTELVQDINPGAPSSYPISLILVNHTLYFIANDGVHGRELWKYQPQQPFLCQASGSILREVWSGVVGSQVSSIPLTTAPSSRSQLTSFEAPTNAGDNYGQRLRGYLCAPTDGQYTFWLASDNDGELWLSSDDEPVNKQRIAYVRHGWVRSRQWEKYPTQRSAPVMLLAGQRYYIEALSKEAGGGDNLAVAWATSPTATPEVIPGSVLSPFALPAARLAQVDEEARVEPGLTLQVHPNPFRERTTVSFTSGHSERAVLELYDLRGMRLREVFQGAVLAGEAVTVEVDGTGLAQGLYLLRLKTASQATHQRLLLQR